MKMPKPDVSKTAPIQNAPPGMQTSSGLGAPAHSILRAPAQDPTWLFDGAPERAFLGCSSEPTGCPTASTGRKTVASTWPSLGAAGSEATTSTVASGCSKP